MVVVVAGCEGLVGTACARALSARSHTVIGLSHTAFSLDEPSAFDAAMHGRRMNAVVCAAARPHVDGCEREPAQTRAINVDGTTALARIAAEQGAMFVAFSSEYVFDGAADRPYVEDDPRNPINEYGRQKRDLEDALGALPGTLVIRTSGVYGLESRRKNFVYQLLERAHAGQRVHVPDDQLITPTYADNLGDLVSQAIERRAGGILHVAGPEPMSRDAFARLVARSFGLPDDVVAPGPSRPGPMVAVRPRRAALSVDKARGLMLSPFIAPREGLARMRASVAVTPQ